MAFPVPHRVLDVFFYWCHQWKLFSSTTFIEVQRTLKSCKLNFKLPNTLYHEDFERKSCNFSLRWLRHRRICAIIRKTYCTKTRYNDIWFSASFWCLYSRSANSKQTFAWFSRDIDADLFAAFVHISGVNLHQLVVETTRSFRIIRLSGQCC